MELLFFDRPILNSPYDSPSRHCELDESGQPTMRVIGHRRSAEFITPIPLPKIQRSAKQVAMVFDEGKGLSSEKQRYDPNSTINALRREVDSLYE